MPTENRRERIALSLIDRPRRPSRLDLDAESLGALTDSLAAEGLYQEVGLIGPDAAGRYETVWGDRRIHAARLLRWRAIDARVYPPGTDPSLAKMNENGMRENLSPVEEAENVRELLDAGQSQAACARLLRRSTQWVADRLAVLQLPEDLRAAVHRRELPVATARALADIDYEPYRKDLIAEHARTGASLRTVEVWRAHYLADRERIVSNTISVNELLHRRESFIVKCPCDLCSAEVPYPDSRGVRLCPACVAVFNDLARELRLTESGTL